MKIKAIKFESIDDIKINPKITSNGSDNSFSVAMEMAIAINGRIKHINDIDDIIRLILYFFRFFFAISSASKICSCSVLTHDLALKKELN